MQTPAAQRWRPIVVRARQSGVSIRVFAEQNGLNAKTLGWWNWRLRDNENDAAFVEAEVADVLRRPLRISVGVVGVEVDDDTDLVLLRRVVQALS